jgi:hypothetical protein
MKTLTECLYQTIHKNHKPLKVIAEELGMSENYLTRAALPDAEDSDTGTGCRFPLKKLIPLIKATDDFTVLDCIEKNLGRCGIALPSAKRNISEICRMTMQAVKEFGDLAGEVEKSIGDDVLTQAECDRISDEGHEAVQAILALMAACKGKSKL